MDNLDHVTPFFILSKITINGQECDRVDFDIAQTDDIFSIIINKKTYLTNAPLTNSSYAKLREYKEMLLALKTAFLMISAEQFATNVTIDHRVNIVIKSFSPTDVSFHIQVYEDNELTMEGVTRISV